MDGDEEARMVSFGTRRAQWIRIPEPGGKPPLAVEDLAAFEAVDLFYRSLCALLYNYVPMSGHPGGSISSGRFVAGLVFDAAEYDLARPRRPEADVVSYAAGHKAMGLYAMWALRDELARTGDPSLLPAADEDRLRLEDLLGFRRNPTTATPLFLRFRARALDGHPTPATPFVRLSTGASGVGVASSIGLALASRDVYGKDAPRVHVVEGEGGLTPGRAAEALAAASAGSLDNVVFHVDWNQASIDSNRVCRDGDAAGDYVQWNPMELFYLHDWNVVEVEDGRDFQQVLAAQRRAVAIDNGQPTAVVYRTVKGWQYGIEGRASHGAGHKLCSEGFYHALVELSARTTCALPSCDASGHRCETGHDGAAMMEQCFYDALLLVREAVEKDAGTARRMAARLGEARRRLDARGRARRADAPRVEAVYRLAAGDTPPAELALEPGTVTTLRAELGRALGHLNEASGGALFVASADLLGSTSVNAAAAGFGEGYWNASRNPRARSLATGGICEDAMAGILSGLSSFGHHVGVGSSYAAFLAPLGHIAARLHAIGSQAAAPRGPWNPLVLVCAHAGLKTGEDGPTHADPQPLQLLQENFPDGTAITLTPWDPRETWPLLAAAFRRRPALVAPFVTRPNETVLDRARLGLAPVEAAAQGVYLLRPPRRGTGDVTLVLQESAVTYAFLERALPILERDGVDPCVYYVASAELFSLLPAEEQARIFPETRAQEAMGITGFTLPTLYRWVRSDLGRAHSLHPFREGHFLGSGPGPMVLAEAGLDGASQAKAVQEFVAARASAHA
jgi:transketolase